MCVKETLRFFGPPLVAEYVQAKIANPVKLKLQVGSIKYLVWLKFDFQKSLIFAQGIGNCRLLKAHSVNTDARSDLDSKQRNSWHYIPKTGRTANICIVSSFSNGRKYQHSFGLLLERMYD